MELCFGGKSSLAHYGLALEFCSITAARRKRVLVNVLAADGSVDALSGFEPTYENRTVTAQFSVAAGTIEDARDSIIEDLEGRWVDIILPDNPNYYMTGLVHIASAGCGVGSHLTVTADCLPWRYARQITSHKIPATEVDVQYSWRNGGKRSAVPELVVGDVPVVITVGNTEKTYVAGVYPVPDLSIPGGSTIAVTARGGAFTARYRDAIL